MDDPSLHSVIATVPSGPWAVGVSGGADSVALLLLLHRRPDLSLHVAHLDHQLRGAESTADAAFVVDLAIQMGVSCTLARRDEIEPSLADLPANPSARYRALRLELFRQTIKTQNLRGVILAHHADDQAETILQRLLRGTGAASLVGMSPSVVVDGVPILRPLLNIPRETLRGFLQHHSQPWREDASNESAKYQRNRVRQWLSDNQEVVPPLLELAEFTTELKQWIAQHAPTLPQRFPVENVRGLPNLLARHAGRQWLMNAGAPAEELTTVVVDRLIQMIADAATPGRQHFPGGVLVRRHAGVISVDSDAERVGRFASKTD